MNKVAHLIFAWLVWIILGISNGYGQMYCSQN